MKYYAIVKDFSEDINERIQIKQFEARDEEQAYATILEITNSDQSHIMLTTKEMKELKRKLNQEKC